ncbi:MAG: trypsin-like peptidase domain-containing protein [Patescibacteria group bacterium]|jgi:serine protease Do
METPRSTTFIVLLAVTVLISTAFGGLGGFLAGQFLSLSSELSFNGEADKNIVRMIEEESSTISVVDSVTPAVVSIIIKQKASVPQANSFNDYFYGQAPSDSSASDELIEVGAGTGFFVTSDGYIVTNRHVADVKEAVFTVVTNDDQEYDATVVDMDPFFDIAIMKIEGANFPTVTFGDSENIQVGQTVIAIGNALSQYQNTVTKGVVSGVNRRISAYDYTSGGEVIEGAIQTDAAINPGNSGGPLINLMGEVIGMNTAVSSNGQGLGFAIPVSEIKQAVSSVQEEGRIVRPWLGVRFVVISKDYAKENDLAVDSGALITTDGSDSAVVADGPAAKAGLKEGDIITKIDGQALTEDETLSQIVREHMPGETLKMTVLRSGTEIEISVTLEEYKESE